MIDIDLSSLDKLSEQTKPLWGIMTPQHMIEHLIAAVQMSNGKVEFKECMNPEKKLPVLKKILMSPRPLPKNFVNTVIGEGLKPLLLPNLDNAKKNLKEELNNFYKYFESNPSAKPLNPTFGPLNKEEWAQFHKKHFTHHFTQFGLIKD